MAEKSESKMEGEEKKERFKEIRRLVMKDDILPGQIKA